MATATPTPVLEITGLRIDLPKGADRKYAVDDVTYTVVQGEILCIVGESGSGKSMSANAVMGLLPKPDVKVSAGSIKLEGEELLTLDERKLRDIRGRRVAMIFQEPMSALNPLMRVGDQVGEVLWAHDYGNRAKIDARVLELLVAVGLPEPEKLRNAYPFALSGGQRQRVMIAMALALEPALLIADEPTTALDVTTQMQILKLIKSIQATKNMAVLFITHDFGVVAEIADRVAVMQFGKIVEAGPATEVLNNPQHSYTKALIGAVPRFREGTTRQATGDRSTVLEAQDLGKTYGGRGWLGKGRTVAALKGVNFTLHRGETLGLVGESGSGKSTVGRTLVRLTDLDRGAIRFDGVDLQALSRGAMRPYRKRIQMVFQDPYASLNPRRKVRDIIGEAMRTHGVAAAEAERRTVEMIRLVGLDPSAIDRYPHEFSGGQRQRIGIARALSVEPQVLIADEAVSALDVSVQEQILKLLDDIRLRLNLSMLFITHDLRVAAQICDTVAVMHRGEIVEYGPTKDVFGAPQHAYTRSLLDAIPGKSWAPPV